MEHGHLRFLVTSLDIFVKIADLVLVKAHTPSQVMFSMASTFLWKCLISKISWLQISI